MNAIELNHVSFRYGEGQQDSLSDVTLHIEKGSCILLCGGSGCGKTTVTRVINGLIPHFYEGQLGGTVTVCGKDIAHMELYELAPLVGTVFQNPRSQFFNVDTTSELAFACENMGMPEEEILQRISRTVEETHIEKLMDRSLFALSGGEKQKIACASVMTAKPEVIVLDEPSANLDYSAILDLRTMLSIWKKQGKTIIIAEHRLGWCVEFADRVVYMEQGRIRQFYTQAEFLSLSEAARSALGLRSLQNTNAAQIEISSTASENMAFENIHFSYARRHPVLDIDRLEIPVGEITAITGKNGAGKSTFLRILTGMEPKSHAVLVWNGKRYKRKDRLKAIYMVMQDVNHQLFTESVLEEVLISMPVEEEAIADNILKELDLYQFRDAHPLALSGGQKQRLAIASAITSGREIIVFDEPTSGLDLLHMRQVSRQLKTLKEMGKTVLVVTHDPELIYDCGARTLNLSVINKGGKTL